MHGIMFQTTEPHQPRPAWDLYLEVSLFLEVYNRIEKSLFSNSYVCVLSVKECWHLLRRGDVPHRGFLVLIYILNIFIATLLLASNSELLEDLVRCFGFVCIHFEIPGLKSFYMFTHAI